MRRDHTAPASRIFAALSAICIIAAAPTDAAAQWTRLFNAPASELADAGRNPYFVLEPGFRITLQDGDDRLQITVLNETKVVAGVTTRIVEEREWVDGKLEEVSRNFYAISRRTNAVYYFGEEVDIYENGKVVRHEGAWEAGRNGATFGMMMPGDPLVGGKYYQELAPRVAMDRAEILDVNASLTVPAGRMTRLLKTRESSDLEKGTEIKHYAPGIGLIQEGTLKLVSSGMAPARR